MADEDTDEQRKQLEEFQRQQAAAALQASQNQPNAIPAEAPLGTSRAIDYTSRGLPTGDTLLGGNASVGVGQTPTPDQQASSGIGNYIGPYGQPLGPTHDLSGAPLPQPEGTTGIQGTLSPQEQDFWRANPAGAVLGPNGQLLGLGETPQPASPDISTGLGATAAGIFGPQQPEQAKVPDFINIPQIDQDLVARRQNISQQISDLQDQLGSASTYRAPAGRHGFQPSQADNIRTQLDTLLKVDHGLALEHHRQMEDYTNATHKNEDMKEKYRINQDSAGARRELASLNPDDPEFAQKAFDLVDSKYPNARKDQRFEAKLQDVTLDAKKRAASRAAAEAAGLTVQRTGYGQRGESVKYVQPESALQQKAITDEARKQTAKDFNEIGLTPDQFAQRTRVERGKYDDKGNFTGSNDGPHVRITTPSGTFRTTNAAYGRMNEVAPGTSESQRPPAASATPAPAQWNPDKEARYQAWLRTQQK